MVSCVGEVIQSPGIVRYWYSWFKGINYEGYGFG